MRMQRKKQLLPPWGKARSEDSYTGAAAFTIKYHSAIFMLITRCKHHDVIKYHSLHHR